MELLPVEKRGDGEMARSYLLRVAPGDPLEPHQDGDVILLRGVEYGVRDSFALPDGGTWTCRLEDLGKQEPPWRDPIPGVWNLGWKPDDWAGRSAITPAAVRGDPRDPAVVAAAQIWPGW